MLNMQKLCRNCEKFKERFFQMKTTLQEFTRVIFNEKFNIKEYFNKMLGFSNEIIQGLSDGLPQRLNPPPQSYTGI